VDPLEEFYLRLAQMGQLAGKPGSQLNTGDLGTLFSPNLGLLTGTLTDTGQSEEDIYASVAPNISRVKNNPDADPIATLIVQNLEGGFSLPQTLIELRKKVSGGDLKAYQEYAKEVSKEMGDVKSALGKRKTVASEAGFPEPGAQYDPTPLMSNIYSRLMQQAQPITPPVPAVVPASEKKNVVGFKALAKTLNPIALLSKLPITPRLTVRRSNGDKKRVAQEEQYTKASEARQQIAAKEYEDVRNLLASAMQKNSLAGSPFMDEVMKRTIMKRLIENPGAINKLTNPQG
jgi:hypothetical protein